MNILLAVLALSTAQPAVTLGEALSLPPDQAGDCVLSSASHGQIIEMEVLPPRGMNPPGIVEVDMREATRTLTGGCHRQSWRVTFLHGPGQTREDARPLSNYASQQVALKSANSCAGAMFAVIGGSLSTDQALTALTVLQKAVSTKRPLKIVCDDKTRSGLCGGKAVLRQELRRLSPWIVTNQHGVTEIWLGTPGQVITKVNMSGTMDRITKVERSVPAPF